MMHMTFSKFSRACLFAGIFLISSPAFSSGESASPSQAESQPSTESQQNVELSQEEDQTPVIVAGPALRSLEEYTVELLTGLSSAEAQYLYNIRARHGIIRSVEVVKEDISTAVKACEKANPDMSGSMTARFNEWDAQVSPILDKAKEDVGRAIAQQTFRPVSRVNTLIEKVEDAFEERDAQISKVPVTTEEACQELMTSLDESEAELVSLLNETISELNAPPPVPQDSPEESQAEPAAGEE